MIFTIFDLESESLTIQNHTKNKLRMILLNFVKILKRLKRNIYLEINTVYLNFTNFILENFFVREVKIFYWPLIWPLFSPFLRLRVWGTIWITDFGFRSYLTPLKWFLSYCDLVIWNYFDAKIILRSGNCNILEFLTFFVLNWFWWEPINSASL